MSDYMYLLDSLINREQSRLLTEVQNAAAELSIALYLTGGAMRDMLGGYPIRDLDFTFEGQSTGNLSKLVAERLPDATCEQEPGRKIVEWKLPCGVTGSLRMAQTATISKPGGTPKITPAHLLEDLSQRDFTIDAMAISLARASRGLIRDPMNGHSDLTNREIRVCYSNAFHDEPVRLLRAIRFKHRLGFQIAERTQRYFETAVEEGWVKTLTVEQWHHELQLIASENNPSEILRELDSVKLLPVSAEILNLEGLGRFEKARQLIPGRATHWPLFLHALTADAKPKDRAAFATAFGISQADADAAKKLKPKVAKLAEALRSPGLRKPSQVYNAVSEHTMAEILALLYESDVRIVQERLHNYLEKYLPEASEITDVQVEATGAKPGSAQFKKTKTALIAAKLNAPILPPPEPVPTPNPSSPQARAIR